MPLRSRTEVFGIPVPLSSRVIQPAKQSFFVLKEDDAYAKLHRETYPEYLLTVVNADEITLERGGAGESRTRRDINTDDLWLPNRRGIEGLIVKRRVYWKNT